MSRGKKWLERGKSLLILLLAVSAGFLAWKTGLFQRILPESVPAAPTEPSPRVSSFPPARLPVSAAVTGASGLIYGVGYDDTGMEGLMQAFRSVLGETLGSASAPETTTPTVWREALLGQGLYLDYGSPVSLNVLARWMGMTAAFSPEQRASRLLLSLAGDQVSLFYLNEQGKACRCRTMALGSALYSGIKTYLPNGAEFSLQLDSLKDCDPYALILGELPALYRVSASNGGREAALQAAAEICGVKLNSGSSFQEQDGTVYLGEEGRLRLERDGSIRYTAAEDRSLGLAGEEAEQIELCRGILAQFSAACGGQGELEYSATRYGEGTVTVLFDYRVEGVRVELSAGSAAWGIFADGALRELGFRPRTYQVTADTVTPIPPLQAAAAAGSLRRGSAAELLLSDPGGETLIEPMWTLGEGSV